VKTVKAKDLFARWPRPLECADPGIQYDDTINEWHTCPESGRITASNRASLRQRVVTDKGLVRIGDIVARAAAGETFAVYTNDVTAGSRDRVIGQDRLAIWSPGPTRSSSCASPMVPAAVHPESPGLDG